MPKRKLLIQLIEDDPVFQKLIVSKVRTIIDCNIDVCSTIDLAVNNFNLNPDLIISDHILPDGNSFDIIEACKTHSMQVPVIVLSEQSKIATAVALMEAGAHTFIEKSKLNDDKLENTIKDLSPYFTLKKDLKNASSMLLGKKQLFVMALVVMFVISIVFMFKGHA